jgi:ketosteroid isomerase-like protein
VLNTREVVEGGWSVVASRPVERGDLDSDRFDRLFADFFAPDIEWIVRMPGAWIERNTYHGEAGVREFFADWFGTFDRVTFEIQRIEVVGHRAVVVVVQRGETGTGPPVEMLTGVVTDVRDGRAVRIELHASPESALTRLNESD